MQQHPFGRDSAMIGSAVGEHEGMVVARTAIGATRIIIPQIGEQLPRIC
jgi:hydrogenase expression/formation protein HypE